MPNPKPSNLLLSAFLAAFATASPSNAAKIVPDDVPFTLNCAIKGVLPDEGLPLEMHEDAGFHRIAVDPWEPSVTFVKSPTSSDRTPQSQKWMKAWPDDEMVYRKTEDGFLVSGSIVGSAYSLVFSEARKTLFHSYASSTLVKTVQYECTR